MPGATAPSVCPNCKGAKIIGTPPNSYYCPMCGGTGKNFDPGMMFWLAQDFNLAGNQALSGQQITLPDTRPFRWIEAVSSSQGTFTINIIDGGTGRKFMNQQVTNTLVFGTAQQPFVLPTPFVFVRQILIDITDTSGAGNVVHLAFAGVQIGG